MFGMGISKAAIGLVTDARYKNSIDLAYKGLRN